MVMYVQDINIFGQASQKRLLVRLDQIWEMTCGQQLLYQAIIRIKLLSTTMVLRVAFALHYGFRLILKANCTLHVSTYSYD
jgi:hypothetical protein